MKYCEKYDFHYSDTKDYTNKYNKAYRKTEGYRENQRKTRKHRKEMAKKWHQENKEHSNAQMRKNYRDNREAYIERSRIYYQNNKEYIVNQKTIERYGITLEERDQMISEQDNKCLRCGKPFEGDGGNAPYAPAIDHDYSFEKGDPKSVNGIIHIVCNAMIGMHKDNIEELELSIEYLKKVQKGDLI